MKIHIDISDEQHKKLKILKNNDSRPFSYFIEKALNKYFKDRKILLQI